MRGRHLIASYVRARERLTPIRRLLSRRPRLAAILRTAEARVLKGAALTPIDQGLRMWVHLDDAAISRALIATGEWQPHESELIRANLTSGDVFVDVGANIGYFSLLGAKALNGSGMVVAIEPDPSNAALLRRNVLCNSFQDTVCICECGAGASPETLELTLDTRNLGNHSFAAENVPDGSRSAVRVVVRTLDDILDSIGVDTVDLLKIDVQGWEARVLAGIARWRLSRAKILIEFWPEGITNAGDSPNDVAKLLFNLGLVQEVVGVGGVRRLDSPESLLRVCEERGNGQVDVLIDCRRRA